MQEPLAGQGRLSFLPFYQPAVQASIPLIAEKQFLMQGNAVINTVSTLAGLLGPVIGGVLFGAFGITQGAMGLGGQ